MSGPRANTATEAERPKDVETFAESISRATSEIDEHTKCLHQLHEEVDAHVKKLAGRIECIGGSQLASNLPNPPLGTGDSTGINEVMKGNPQPGAEPDQEGLLEKLLDAQRISGDVRINLGRRISYLGSLLEAL